MGKVIGQNPVSALGVSYLLWSLTALFFMWIYSLGEEAMMLMYPFMLLFIVTSSSHIVICVSRFRKKQKIHWVSLVLLFVGVAGLLFLLSPLLF